MTINTITGLFWAELLRGGAGRDSIDGAEGDDTIFSGSGKDTVHGGSDNDTIYNDFGNDRLYGDSGSDTISFAYFKSGPAPGEMEAYYGGARFDLAKSIQTVGVFGKDFYSGFENVTGSGGADVLLGNKYGNVLSGLSGKDKLYGRAGNDTILGGNGADLIQGGKGADKLGGSVLTALADDGYQDIFRYKALNESRATVSGRDTIWGSFEGGLGDKIDLHLIDANGSYKASNGKFKFIGNLDFDADTIGEVQVRHLGDGEFYLVSIDADEDNGAEMAILVHSLTALTSADFIL